MNIAQVNKTVLYDKVQIDKAINQLVAAISKDFADSLPICLTVMNGGLIFAGNLLIKLPFDLETEYCHASRYGNKERGTTVQWKVPPPTTVQGRKVLIIDDIYDEGITLKAVIDKCRQLGAVSIGVAVLVNKVHQRKTPLNADFFYRGLDAPDEFIVGYGLDYKKRLRNLNGIYTLKEE